MSFVDVLRRQTTQALYEGRLDAAEDLVQRLEDEDPLSVSTRGLRLELLLRAGRVDEAEPLARQLLELFPGSARVHWLAARLASERRDWAAAERHARESDALHPHWRSRHLLGRALVSLGRFEEGEAVLRSLLPERVVVHRDLAWLFERRGQHAQAVSELERLLAAYPDDESARAQKLRLEARLVAPAELVDEVEELMELGEDVAPELVPEYVRTLLETGAGARARAFVGEHAAEWSPLVAAKCAWNAYRLQAWDLACELFVRALPARRDPKTLSALEAAAKRSARVEMLIAAYQELAQQDPKLFGRIRSLQRHV